MPSVPAGWNGHTNQEKLHHLATGFIIVTPYLVRSLDGNLLIEGSLFFLKKL